MSKVVEFPTVKNRFRTEDLFITVLHEPDMHITWNRGTLFYIKASKYPIKQHILCYARCATVEVAQQMAKHYYEQTRKENHHIAALYQVGN
jgi:hypothetical protein